MTTTDQPDFQHSGTPIDELTELANAIGEMARAAPGIGERIAHADLIVHLSVEGPGGQTGLGFNPAGNRVDGDGLPTVAIKLARSLNYVLTTSAKARAALENYTRRMQRRG